LNGGFGANAAFYIERGFLADIPFVPGVPGWHSREGFPRVSEEKLGQSPPSKPHAGTKEKPGFAFCTHVISAVSDLLQVSVRMVTLRTNKKNLPRHVWLGERIHRTYLEQRTWPSELKLQRGM